MVDNEPEWVLEYERQERRTATELRKREMEERIDRVRQKEKNRKKALGKGTERFAKQQKVIIVTWEGVDDRERHRRKMRRNFFWESIIPRTKSRNRWIREISLEAEI